MSIIIAAAVIGCMSKTRINAPKPEISQQTNIGLDTLETKGRLYETTIAKMDPYVSRSKDGLYSIDFQGFLNANQLTSDEMKIASELNQGIQVANKEIRSGQSMAAGSACWWFWWGRKCCYWGADGWRIVTMLGVVGSGGAYYLPGIGAITGALAAYLGGFMSVYNGFCANQSWIGNAVWFTRP